MPQHYNLYYLFLEDRAKHPIPPESDIRIRKNLEEFYRHLIPPGVADGHGGAAPPGPAAQADDL